ncbi:hypothetical protein ACFY19_20850 [Streptosporangium saharense]|uniref:hypothetical protein n=1 Tax=Streptosporangium saharense TaxID=1706840 RepID=UPI00368C4295
MTMSPAEELRAAAAHLRQTAAAAVTGDRTRWMVGATLRSKTPVVVDDRDRPTVLIEAFARNYEQVGAWIALACPALAEPFGELLGQIADGMDDHGAHERYAGTDLGGPDRRRVVADENGRVRHDWTAALDSARVILGTAR